MSHVGKRLAVSVTLATVVLWPASPGMSDEAANLSRLFPLEADVSTDGAPPLSRLLLPPEVLSACRPDLSDLRLFDAAGKEIPFLVDAGAPPDAAAEVVQRYEPRPAEAARSETRRETGPPLRRESFEITMPATAPRSGSWVLAVEPKAAEFVARVQVEGIRADGASTALMKDASIFRLKGARPAEKTRLSLPRFDGPRLRVVLETEHPFWLEPAMRLESARRLESGGQVAVPLAVLSARSAEGRTVVEVARPAGIVPDMLRLQTTTGTFDRAIHVWDEGQTGAATEIGSGRVFRVAALVPVGEDGIALRPARGDRLRIEIDDGDSPSLEAQAFSAVIRQPSLVFAGRGGTLRFGGGRARIPRYDLAGLLPPAWQSLTGKRAEGAAALYDPATVRAALLGAPRPNPLYDRAPALAFTMHAGAAIDPGIFSHARPLTVPDAPEGLSRLRIEPADLAILHHTLGDLRVADETSRQWPYLLVPDATTDEVPLGIEGPSRHGRSSRYALRPPVAPLRFDRLTFDAGDGFFDRTARIAATDGDGAETTLMRGRLTRPVGDTGRVAVDVGAVRATSITVEIDDGDDAPLAFRSVQARVPLPQLYLTAPPGRYTLLLGASGQGAPRYELERVRDVVLAVQAAPIIAGPLERNRSYNLSSRLKGFALWQSVLLWGTLLLAVAVLSYLTLRLARGETPRE